MDKASSEMKLNGSILFCKLTGDNVSIKFK